MSAPRTFRVTTSLAAQMRQPGGRTVGAAVSAAGAALEERREAAMADIGEVLEQLQAVVARRGAGDAEQIYDRAAALLDVAGFFDTGPLYDAAYSLCDLSERMQAASAWRWPAVEVHLQALALILAAGCRHDAASDALLTGLRAVVERVPTPPAG